VCYVFLLEYKAMPVMNRSLTEEGTLETSETLYLNLVLFSNIYYCTSLSLTLYKDLIELRNFTSGRCFIPVSDDYLV
jgi:hypothetical protein